MTFTESFIHTGQIALNVAEWDAPSPDSPKMILVHGYGSNWHTWGRVVDKLSAEFHLFALDLRAMGRSGRQLPASERQTSADDVTAVISILSDQPVFLVGHSYGGWITAAVAAQHPELVAKIVLAEPYTGAQSEFRKQERMKRLEQRVERAGQIKAARTPEDLIPMVEARYGGASEDSIRRIARMYFELDPVMEASRPNPSEDNDTFDGIFTAIECPTLIIRGAVENGGIMSDEEAERVVGLIPDSRELSWPRVGHSPHIARNHDFIRAIKRFWAS